MMAEARGKRGRSNSRASDERLLHALRLRAQGWENAQLAAQFGTTTGGLRRDLNRIIAADLAESGEPAAQVLRAYPWRGEP